MMNSDFPIRVSYVIEGLKLTTQIECENIGDDPLPYGLGTHAYFRLPLSDGADPERTKVTLPQRKYGKRGINCPPDGCCQRMET